MILNDKRIAIIGGGPGGLMLARLLQLKGADLKVYERDSGQNARVQGSPLDMHENSGLLSIMKAGLLNEFKKNIRFGADKKIITDEKANVFLSDHDNHEKSAFSRPEIDRGALRKIMLGSLQANTVLWNRHFISMEEQGGGWLLHFKDKPSAYADLVIAADGANSKVRPYLTSIRPMYSGITMVEINISDPEKNTPRIYKLLQGGKVMAFGNSQCILGGQKGEGGIGFYLSFKTDEDWTKLCDPIFSDKAQFAQWFKRDYFNWDEVWLEIIENAEMPIVPRPIYYMPDENWPSKANLTIIGDAAHVMPPFAGEGANTALFDALKLSEYLTSDNKQSTADAIAAYEEEMRERASKAIFESLENGEKMHSETALRTMRELFSS